MNLKICIFSLFFLLFNFEVHSTKISETYIKNQNTNYRNILKKKFNLEKIRLEFNAVEVNKQSKLQSKLNKDLFFEKALEIAMNTILSSYEDWESPLAMIIEDSCFELYNHSHELCFRDSKPVEEVMVLSVQSLLSYLNSPKSTLSILGLQETPEQQESVKENWIFHLQMNDYSDHLYWVIIDRTGTKKPYLYGFN